jgi:thiamine pyrophosphate-dependent acetolactate synthase large subunit-like protein
MTISAGEAVVASLRAHGVRHVFGICGSSLIEVLDALYGLPDLTYVGVRHEQVAAHAADGYARASGGPGVCLATNGPGVTNLVTGVACARACFSPVVVLAGAVMQGQVYRGVFQELDQKALFAPVTKLAIDVPSARRIPDLMAQAFRVATAGRRGPIVLNFPRDLLNESLEMPKDAPAIAPATRPGADARAVERAASRLAAAERPVVIAGGGVVWSGATREVLAVADRLAAPIVTGYGHNDAVPASHPLVLGAVGRAGSPEAIEAVRRADVILAAGSRLGHFTTFFDHRLIPADAAIVQIELDEEALGRYYPAAEALHGDAAVVLRQLAQALGGGAPADASARRRWAEGQRALRRQRIDRDGCDESVPIKPRRVAWELRQVLPDDAIVVFDSTAGAAPAYDMLDFHEPRTLLDSLDWGCVGAGFPTALGARFAAPGRPVVCLAGDGGFLMTSQDLETAVRSRVPLVTIVFNNGCWGIEKAYQKHFFDGRYVGADFGNPAFDRYAESFGALGLRVERPAEIRPALEKALAATDRPAVIEIVVDPEALPYPARTEAVRADRLR